MKWKNIIKAVLVIFIVLSAGYIGFDELVNQLGLTGQESEKANLQTEATGNSANPAKSDVGEGRKVIAYYFHGDVRCPRCRRIEAYALEALMIGFPNELQSGALEWRVVNVQKPQNEHFVWDYNLLTWSLVLVEVINGQEKRWKNLQSVWDLVVNHQAFLNYVQTETQSYLGGN